MSNITILGGGNMGSVLAVKFSQKHNVCLFVNSPYEKVKEYDKNMVVFNEDSKSYITGKIDLITDNLKTAICYAEWIFVTFPSFLFKDFSAKIIPLLRNGQHLVGIPGSGGFELFFKNALKKECTITGLQRVHSVARIIKQGKEVRESGIRQSIRCASLPKSFNAIASTFLSEAYSLPVEPLSNYLNITLVNSNPILHTSRLYSIFNNYSASKEYDYVPLFYEEWDLESSELLIKMDTELFNIINALNKIGIEVRNITTLLDHYESKNAVEMTAKLNSIKSLKGLKTPTILTSSGKQIPDLNSRYFTADFPLGLDILLSFSFLLKIDCPFMNKVSQWYHLLIHDNKRFDLTSFGLFEGNDLLEFYNG